MTALGDAEADAKLYDELVANGATTAEAALGVGVRSRFRPGGSWIFDGPAEIETIWGAEGDVAWSAGEPLYLSGVAGVGKSTLAAQLSFGRCGLIPELLGWPIARSDGPVLYLAMDRPKQIRRLFRRLANPEDRALLDERLIVRPGPLPADLGVKPELLLMMVEECGAGTVVLDSAKDAAAGLTEDKPAGSFNRALQMVAAADVEVLVVHHEKKGKASAAWEQMYGNQQLTSGAGSILALRGEPGSARVQMLHVKQPMDTIGPLWLHHDHETGHTTLDGSRFDLLTWLGNQRIPVSTAEVAGAKHGVAVPSPTQCESMGRQLRRLRSAGKVAAVDGEGVSVLWEVAGH